MELWECMDCFAVAPLGINGHCARCNSAGVMSCEKNYKPKPNLDERLKELINRLRMRYAPQEQVDETVERILTK